MKLTFIKILILTLISFFVFPVYAASPDYIIITEIMYNLEGVDNPHEWVEIYNASNGSVDLTGWRFNDGKNHKLNPPPEKGWQGSIIIQPDEYAILASDMSQ